MAHMRTLLPYNWDPPELYPGMVAVAEGKIRTPDEVAKMKRQEPGS